MGFKEWLRQYSDDPEIYDALVNDPVSALYQITMPQSALDRTIEKGITPRITSGREMLETAGNALDLIFPAGTMAGANVEGATGSKLAGLAAAIAMPEPNPAGKLKRVEKAAAEVPRELAHQWPKLMSMVRRVTEGGLEGAQSKAEDIAYLVGKRLEGIAPEGTVFEDLLKKVRAPKVTGRYFDPTESSHNPFAREVQLGTFGFNEPLGGTAREYGLEDLANILNHEKFHSYWRQINELANKGDEAARYAVDKFTKVLGDVTGFRRPGSDFYNVLKKAGRDPRIDNPHVPEVVQDVAAAGPKAFEKSPIFGGYESVEEAAQKGNLGAYADKVARAASYREGERLSDLFAMLQTPQGRAELGDKVLNELSGIFDFSGGKAAGPGYKKGGKVPDKKEKKTSIYDVLMALLQERMRGDFTKRGSESFLRGQSGGQVPRLKATLRMPTQEVMDSLKGIENYAGGGVIPNAISGFENFNPSYQGTFNAANTAGKAASELQGFNPFQGQGRATLNEMLASGRPVDTSAIGEAAKTDATDWFNQQVGGINESLGAMGLGSSTSRTQAIAGAGAQAARGIGSDILRAGVGAAENAANRSLNALNPYMAGTGQQLSANQSALQGILGAGNLQLGAESNRASNRLGALQGMSGIGLGLAPIQAQQMNMVPQGVTQPTSGGGIYNASSTNFGRTAIPSYYRAQGGGEVPEMAVGGTVNRVTANQGSKREDFGDYMSNLLYGRTFNRMTPQPVQKPQMIQMAAPRPQQAVMPQIQNYRQGYGHKASFDPVANAQRAADSYKMAKSLMAPYGSAGFGQNVSSIADMINAIGGPTAAHQGMMSAGEVLAAMAQAQQGAAGEVFKGAGSKQKGGPVQSGEIDGPAVPPDRVPIMAQGGEGIIPVREMHALEKSTSSDPLVMRLKEIMGFACGGKVGYKKGGKVEKVMGEYKRGTLHSGSKHGPKVTSRDQAIAIALSEARKAGQMQTGGQVKPKKKKVEKYDPKKHFANAQSGEKKGGATAMDREKARGAGGLGALSRKVKSERDAAKSQSQASRKGEPWEKSAARSGAKFSPKYGYGVGVHPYQHGGEVPVGPYQMFQDPSLYEERYGPLPSSDEAQMRLDAIRKALMEEEAANKEYARFGEPGKPTASVMKSDVSYNGRPLTGPLTEEQKRAKIMEDAARRMSLIQSAMVLDPQGGGIHQSGPGMMAAAMKQYEEAAGLEAEMAKAEAQQKAAEAYAGRYTGQQSVNDKRTQQIIDDAYKMTGKESPNGAPYTEQEVAQIAAQRLEAAGLPVPPHIAEAAQAGPQTVTESVQTQGQGQQADPAKMFGQFFSQGGQFEQLPPEVQQQFIQWVTPVLQSLIAQNGLSPQQAVQEVIKSMAQSPVV